MNKLKKAFLPGLLLTVFVLANGIIVQAGRDDCARGMHSPLVIYNMTLQSRTKTGEHSVKTGNGMEAVCYIYDESYDVTYYCQTCGAKPHESKTVTDVHSICPN